MKISKRRKQSTIPIAAMGDIAFLLLVFYMATTMVTDQKPMDVDLPEVEGYSMNSPYPLIVYLDEDLALKNRAFFFNQTVAYEDLPGLIQDRANSAPAAVRVYLNVSKDLPYRHTHRVMDLLKRAGVRNLVITTRPAGKKSGGPS